MELQDAIFGRRSIRSFKQDPIKIEIVYELINAAIYAPSACNKQAWKFIIIDDLKMKNLIQGKIGSPLITNSPIGILVLYRNDVTNNSVHYKDQYQSASAAIQNMLLLAYEKGIGSCWVCKLPPKQKVRKVLKIPKQYDVIAYVALGYTKEYLIQDTIRHYNGSSDDAQKRKRLFSVEQVTSHNEFKEHYCKHLTKKYFFIRHILHCITLKIENKRLRDSIAHLRDSL